MRRRVLIPATSANLGPGFDVLGVALHFYNEVTLEASGPFGSRPGSLRPNVVVEGEGASSLPLGANNLVVRAAYKVFEAAKRWPKTLDVTLLNRIPLSRGLGSSAAATIGGMAAANALLGRRLPDQVLLELAVGMEGHPDNVVPAFFGGLCVSGRVNGRTEYLRFNVPSGLRAVICSPERPLSTEKARKVLPNKVALSTAVFTASRVAFLLGALLEQKFDRLGFAMEDLLHQPARAGLLPGLSSAIRAAQEAGAYGAALSGAGSSVIALSRPGPVANRVGKAMERAFGRCHVASASRVLALENTGVRGL